MNISKNFFPLFLLLVSFLFSSSNTCGSSLILDFTSNRSNIYNSLLRTTTPGSIATFYVRNLSTNILEEIQFQLLATDGVTHFYGEASEIANNNINTNAIDLIFNTFTLTTQNADSLVFQNGIKSAEEEILGLPPKINGNREVYVLFMDIRDAFSNSGEFVAGFFDPQDQKMCIHSDGLSWQPDATISNCTAPYYWVSNGNGLNIIYIDSNQAKIDEDGIENTLFTLAHEYQHLLHWNVDIREGYFGSAQGGWTFHNPWLNEGLSDLMPSILGLGERDFSPYLQNPLIGIDEWSEIGSQSTLPYYAKSALFVEYLYETEGLAIISSIFNSTSQGLTSIKSHFTENEFDSLYQEWIEFIVTGQIEGKIIEPQVFAYNIENQISLGKQSAIIEIDASLPPYAFSLINMPDFLHVNSIELNSLLNISLYNNEGFSYDDNFLEEHSTIKKVILYSKDIGSDNVSFNLLYDYRYSPNNENLFIYPNPITDNVLSYKYFGNPGSSILSLKLFDLSGKQVLSIEPSPDSNNNYRGNLSVKLASGTYIVQSMINSQQSDHRIISVIK